MKTARCWAVVWWMLAGMKALAAEPFSVELEEQRLLKEGFHLTMRFASDETAASVPPKEFIIPEGGDNRVSVWAASDTGDVEVQLLKPDSSVLLRWTGSQGASVVSAFLAPGKYRLVVKTAAGQRVQGIVGVSDRAVGVCAFDMAQVTQREAQPQHGFYWPYLLYVPAGTAPQRLLVAPNNTGFVTQSEEHIQDSAKCQLRGQAHMADKLGVALLIPLFPRPAVPGEEENLYLHALSRAALTAQTERWKRVDLQLAAMIADARTRVLKGAVDERVLLFGFSASGSFVNRFALLHPAIVSAVAVGSPGGWPMVPSSKRGSDVLPYPVGTGDMQQVSGRAFQLSEARRVRWFFYLGGEDSNDAVPFRDSFSREAQTLIEKQFGRTPQARWKVAERLYREQGMAARFVVYPRVAHAVTAEMELEVMEFFQRSIGL